MAQNCWIFLSAEGTVVAAGLEENVFAATILWMPRMGMTGRFATEAQSSEWRSHDKLHTLTGFWEEEEVFGWERKVYRWEGSIITQISSFGLCSE